MIFDTNRTMSLSEQSVGINKKYLGSGMLVYAQECAQDELSIFEMAIKTDIDEALCESYSDIQALHEGFIEKVGKKIKEIYTKLKEWLQMVLRSVLAKLNQYFTNDNKKFVERANNAFKKLTSAQKGKIDFQAKVFTTSDFKVSFSSEKVKSIAEKASKADTTISEAEIKQMEDEEKEMIDFSFSEAFDAATSLENCTMTEVNKALDELKKATNKDIKDVKKQADKYIKEADKFIREAEKLANKKDLSGDDAEKANNKVKVANIYKSLVQKELSTGIQLIKAVSKLNRAIVSKALVGKLSEGFVYESNEMMIASLQSAEFELESSLEEAKCHEKCDDDDDDKKSSKDDEDIDEAFEYSWY